jgi:hypothetical protein
MDRMAFAYRTYQVFHQSSVRRVTVVLRMWERRWGTRGVVNTPAGGCQLDINFSLFSEHTVRWLFQRFDVSHGVRIQKMHEYLSNCVMVSASSRHPSFVSCSLDRPLAFANAFQDVRLPSVVLINQMRCSGQPSRSVPHVRSIVRERPRRH